MNNAKTDPIVDTLAEMIAERLSQAASLAKAEEACANAGNRDGACQIMLDVDQPIFEAQSLLNAASLINRLARES